MAAEKGNNEAQANVAKFYFYGYGVDENIPMAIELYEVSANNGNAKAAKILSYLFSQGEVYGVKPDAKAAEKWTLKAEENTERFLRELKTLDE